MNTKKLDSLQTIRALAFLGIFTSHTGIKAFGAGGPWGGLGLLYFVRLSDDLFLLP